MEKKTAYARTQMDVIVFDEEDVPQETLCEEAADILLEVLDFIGNFC